MRPKNKAICLFLTIICYLLFQNIRLSLQLTFDTTTKDADSKLDLPILLPPTYNSFNSNFDSNSNSIQRTTSQQCRLQWDLQKKDKLINEWVALELPILVGAVRVRDNRGATPPDQNRRNPKVGTGTTAHFYNHRKPDMVYITLTQAHLRQNNNVDLNFKKIHWKCIYGTQTQTQTQPQPQTVEEVADHIPHAKPEAVINLMCNSTVNNRRLTGIYPTQLTHPTNTTFVYSLEEPLECDRLEEYETAAIHKHNKLGACLRFKGDYDRSLVPQWIEYHRILGMQHFWIYVNEEWDLKGLYNTSYITYIPFDFVWDNHQPHFRHHYASYAPEISQEPAIYNCVWNAKKYGYDWVTATDVDEWIRVPSAKPQRNDLPPLQSYFQKFDPQQIGCFIMKSVAYGSNWWLHHPTVIPPPLLIDYVWRQNKNLSDYYSREKPIFNPQSVWSIGVHFCWQAQGIKQELKPQDGDLYVQHYKLAHKGVYKKMAKKMVESQDDLLQDSTMRDTYRSELVQALEKLQHQQTNNLLH